MDKCPKQNQEYKDAHLSGKNGQVSDSRIRGIHYPPEKKREKKKKKRKKDSPCSPKAKIKEEERQQYEEQ